jgi:primosomal protein N' (replication factor Y)
MRAYVEVAVNIPTISDVFHYHLPEELEGLVNPGHLVTVPFGSQIVQGVVLREIAQPEVAETRPVESLVDEAVVLTQSQLALARQLSEDSLAPLAACISLMIPIGLEQHADVLYSLGPYPLTNSSRSAIETKLVALLARRGPLRGRQIDQAFPHQNWQASARRLVKRSILTARPVLPPPSTRPRLSRQVSLACTAEQAQIAMQSLGNKGGAALARRQAILRFLLNEEKPVDAAWLYAESGGSLTDLKVLEKLGLVQFNEVDDWRDPLSNAAPELSHALSLTQDQQIAWNSIKHALDQAQRHHTSLPLLLHGVTGSGKTELYLQAAAETLRMGRQVIVLVPEIAMTPQAVQRFASRFPGKVGLMHSRLSPGERYDTWRRARMGSLSLIVGPRSALFAPFSDLGLIIVDECHDSSYFNTEQPPYYNARHAAVTYAHLCGAVCLLGSATPDLESRYLAEQGQWAYIHLPERILAHQAAVSRQLATLQTRGQRTLHNRFHPLENEAQMADLPPVRLVDMRIELKSGNRSIFSRALQQALQDTLDRGEQAILFINRRGSASYVFCRDCGAVAKCPRCEIPLTYHTTPPQTAPGPLRPALICHRCGYSRQMPSRCPACHSTQIRQYGLGTERVETEIRQQFPDARVLRWDYDTTRQKDAHQVLFEVFSRYGADILIGTQMIAKGLDLPLVTLVGAVLADVGLALPDLRASERTFQVLAQVAGRAGRSPLGGQAILQTFQPEHYVLQAVATHNYAAFYQTELSHRRALGYPPFSRLVRMEYRHSDQERAQSVAFAMAAQVKTWLARAGLRQTELIGPAPCFYMRLAGLYRWQIILRGPNPANALRGQNLSDWRVEVDPLSLL